ncbi:MAG: hypothetical protein FH749_12295 [Firmicutes bacterium]|nr:hypothetical protein [Bacillota bacterium]
MGKLPRLLLICLLCLGLVVIAGCGRDADESNNTEPPPDKEEPLTPPDHTGSAEPTGGELFAPQDLEDLISKLSVLSYVWEDEARVYGNFRLSVEGRDSHGEKLLFDVFADNLEEKVDMWVNDGIIVKVEPEDQQERLLNTNGSEIYDTFWFPILLFNTLHEQHNNAPSEFVQVEVRGTETRNLVHMRLPVTHYFISLNNQVSGEEWTLEYWLGEFDGFNMAVEWFVDTGNETFTRYEIIELKLR